MSPGGGGGSCSPGCLTCSVATGVPLPTPCPHTFYSPYSHLPLAHVLGNVPLAISSLCKRSEALTQSQVA